MLQECPRKDKRLLRSPLECQRQRCGFPLAYRGPCRVAVTVASAHCGTLASGTIVLNAIALEAVAWEAITRKAISGETIMIEAVTREVIAAHFPIATPQSGSVVASSATGRNANAAAGQQGACTRHGWLRTQRGGSEAAACLTVGGGARVGRHGPKRGPQVGSSFPLLHASRGEGKGWPVNAWRVGWRLPGCPTISRAAADIVACVPAMLSGHTREARAWPSGLRQQH